MKRVAFTPGERYYILTRDAFACQYCGRKAPEVELHVDHIVPVAAGGTNTPSNLLASCSDCNLAKNANVLPQELLLEKIKGTHQRTLANPPSRFKSNMKRRVPKPTPEHCLERPGELIAKNKQIIQEPMKGLKFSASRRHGLNCVITPQGKLELTRVTKYKYGWDSQEAKLTSRAPVWTPLNESQLADLFHSENCEFVDSIKNHHQEVQIVRDRNGLCFLFIVQEGGMYVYAFWVPLKEVEFYLSFEGDEEAEEEAAFWQEQN